MGEALFRYLRLRGMEKFLHGPGNGAAPQACSTRSARCRCASSSCASWGWCRRGRWRTSSRARSAWPPRASSRASPTGRIDVRRDCTITRLRRAGRPSGRRALRRHDAARRPRRLRHRLHPGRAVPRRRPCRARLLRRARQLPALPPDPAAGRAGAVLQRLQLVVLQPAERRDGGGVDRGRPRGRGGAARRPRRCAAPWSPSWRSWTRRPTGTTAAARKIIPFSLHNVDEVLDDLGLNIPPGARLALAGPGRPAAYRRMTPLLPRRLPPSGPRPGPGFTGLTPVGTSPEAEAQRPAVTGLVQGHVKHHWRGRARPGKVPEGLVIRRPWVESPQHPWGPAQLPAECGSAAADGRCSCASARGQSPGGGPQLELSGVPGGGCLLAAGLPGSRGLALARHPRGRGRRSPAAHVASA